MVTHHTASVIAAKACGRSHPRADSSRPAGCVAHRGDGPVQGAFPGRGTADVLPVPRDPALGAAEPGMLTARREQNAALRTITGLIHRVNGMRGASLTSP